MKPRLNKVISVACLIVFAVSVVLQLLGYATVASVTLAVALVTSIVAGLSTARVKRRNKDG